MRTLLFLFFTSAFFSAHPQSVFQKTYGKTANDYGYTIQNTYEGGFIISGLTNSYGGSNYLYLLKTDQAGDTLWMKGYATTLVSGYSLQQTNDSGFIISGSGGILKTDRNGIVQWGSNYQSTTFNSVQQTSDGGYILSGSIGTTSSSNGMDVYLLKLNSNGIKQWSRKLGGTLNDYSHCIRQTNDGGYISCGSTNSFGGGNWDIYLVKINSNGDTLWTKTYGDLGNDGGTTGKQSLELTGDGGFIIGAQTTSFGAGGTDAYLINTDSGGVVQWSKTYGGIRNEIIFSVKQTGDGGFAFTGQTNSFGAGSNDVYVVKTNSSGDTLWTRVFGGTNNDVGQELVEANDKGYAIIGYTNDFGSGNNDVFLIKTDSLGNSSCNQYSSATQVSAPITKTFSTSTKTVYITLNISSLSPTFKSGGVIKDACVTNAIEIFGQKNILNVFPDPSDGTVFIEWKEKAEKIKISVTDILGNIIYREELKNAANKTELNLKDLANGTYFIKAEAATIYIAKIIISR